MIWIPASAGMTYNNPMILVDIILVLILLGLAGRGWKQGFVDSLAELIGAVIAFVVARSFSPLLVGMVGWMTPGRPGLARFIAFVILFAVVMRLVGWILGLAADVLNLVARLPLISMVNKLLGGILGFLSGIVVVGSTVYLVMTFRLDPTLMSWLGGSTVARYTETVFSGLLRFLL